MCMAVVIVVALVCSYLTLIFDPLELPWDTLKVVAGSPTDPVKILTNGSPVLFVSFCVKVCRHCSNLLPFNLAPDESV